MSSRLSHAPTLVHLLRHRAEDQPYDTAYQFLADSGQEAVKITYAELDQQARFIAARLQVENPFARSALLLFPTSPEYLAAFWGCLYAGVTAIPAYPPHARRRDARIQSIIANAQPDLILARSNTARRFLSRTDDDVLPGDAGFVVITYPEPHQSESNWNEPALDRDSLAYIQYTSGSTRSPRGVVLTHGHLLHNLEQVHASLGLGSGTAGVSWLPLYHDMGLVGTVLSALYTGKPLVLMSPTAFAQHPIRWLRAISDYRASVSVAPCSAYQLCVDRSEDADLADLDLRSWDRAVVGAEPVRAEVLERFAHTFAPYGFRPEAFRVAYGLAEATLMVSAGRPTVPEPSRHLDARDREDTPSSMVVRGLDAFPQPVDCGSVLPGARVVIVDPATLQPCPAGQEGEIWVASPSVANGYWRQPKETEEIFGARLAPTGEGPFLRTGDLGRTLGEVLFVTGRIKDLIIIRGVNFYPQDIEYVAQGSHPALSFEGGAAFSVFIDDEEKLFLVHELKRSYRAQEPKEIESAIRRAIALEFGLHVHTVVLLKPGQLPRTSSGKVRRTECRRLALKGSSDSILYDSRNSDLPSTVRSDAGRASPMPGGSTEELVHTICCDVLRREIGIQDELQAYGVESISAAQIMARIRGELQVDLPVSTVFHVRNISELASVIDAHQAALAQLLPIPLERVDRQSNLPLSYAQERMWFLQRLDPHGSAYNMSGTLYLRGPLDQVALRQSIDALIERHETLRTTFRTTEDGLRPAIAETQEIPIRFIDLTAQRELQHDDRLQEMLSQIARKPFELGREPPMRVSLIGLAPQEHIIHLDVHHIIADAWSFGIVARELATFYNGYMRGESVDLPQLPFQYVDYAAWQRRRLAAGLFGEQLEYWRQKLAGIPALHLPTDRPRPAVQNHRGRLEQADLPEALVAQLRQLSRQHGVTSFMTLLAAFHTLLYRYTGQTDIAVAVPVAGRDLPATEQLIGVFTNTLVMRGDLSDAPTFEALLQRTHKMALEAFSNQDVPFARIVAELHPERDPSRAPLAQVMRSVINVPLAPPDLEGIAVTPVLVDRHGAQFDLTLTVMDTELERKLIFEYSTDLFERDTIHRMARNFQTLLEAIVGDPRLSIEDLPLLTQAERGQLLSVGNGPVVEYAPYRCVHHLFEEQAGKTPNGVAMIGRALRLAATEQVTYGELNWRADRLADYLRQVGIGPGDYVGISVERTTDMVVGVLGILKAGGAYVALDPTFPARRLEYMLQDSQATVLLTQLSLRAKLPHPPLQVICLDSDWEAILRAGAGRLEGECSPSQVAYLMYTSGSTGQPKGVQIPHRALTNFLHAMRHEPGLAANDVLVSVTTLSFDIAALELFLPLVSGARVVILGHQEAADGALLSEALDVYGATVMQATPATWRMLIDAGWRGRTGLKMLCGGEALPRALADELLERGASLWNMYGPTETTIWSSAYEVKRGAEPIHLGYPIANTQFFVFDSRLQPVPIGVPGELYIGGDGVASGYHRRPELTAERFLSHPAHPRSRIYRTGDIVRQRADHTLEFLGRADFQVKVRGFRIELDEISSALGEHPGIKHAAVIPRRNSDDENQLSAYYVPENGQSPTPRELRTYLSECLPGYMVPAHFHEISALPLTSNGKLDRQALALYAPAVSAVVGSFVAPQDDVERVLVRIWADMFARTPIGVDDNFFHLGGDSLSAVRMASRAYAALGKRFAVISLFQYPTIAQLANALRNDPDPLFSPTVVPLYQGGSLPPFFCVHGFGGEVMGYREFVEHLGVNQPVFGLRARGMEGEDEPHADIGEMASFYIDAMRGMQPRGPYYLGGYCYGGVVAYEMARQLAERGEEIGLLAIFEGYAPNPEGTGGSRLRPRAIARALRNIPPWFRDYGVEELLRVTASVSKTAPDMWGLGVRNWDAWLRNARLAAILEEMMDLPDHRVRVIESHLRAIRLYRPQPYPGRAALFRVRAMSLSRAHDPEFGWGALARGGVDVHVLPGAHHNIMQYPYVAVSAAELRQALALAREGRGGRQGNDARKGLRY